MAHTFNTGVKSIAIKYKKLLGAKITDGSLEKAIQSHPYYPTLYSLSDTFNKFKIDNKAYKINPSDFVHLDIETPFVAYTKIRDVGDDFILVTQKDNNSLTYQYKENKEKTITIDSFLSFDTNELLFRGIVWKAETTKNSIEAGYKNKLKTEKSKQAKGVIISLIMILMLITIIILNASSENVISFIIITCLKIAGLVSVGFLLIYEVDKNNAFVKNICSLNKKTNCTAVLDSKASKIFGISLGEIGLFYFGSTILGLLMPSMDFAIKVNWLAVVNILVLPFVFFSIYYQWRVIKQWCIFCLTVQCILVSEFLWACFYVWGNGLANMFTLQYLPQILLIVLLPIVLWHIIKPILIKFNNHDNYLYAYQRLQYNPEIFKQLLTEQQGAPRGWENLGIDIGDVNATNTIIKICNPYCTPCDMAHLKLEELLENNNSIKLKIIFITSNNENDVGRDIVKHLLEIASHSNEKELKNALDDWYLHMNKDYNLFANKYKLPDALFDRHKTAIEEMSSWCRAAKVVHTPTIYVNGHLLPENYNISELRVVLTD